jgi:hypothetical protein
MTKLGRPFEPGNHCGRGRPKGSRNKQTQSVKQIAEKYDLAIFQKSLSMALQGNVTLLRTFTSDTLSRLKDALCKIGRGADTPELIVQFVRSPRHGKPSRDGDPDPA